MIASNATISTQHGCASTQILHAHQVHVMHGKTDRNHGKIKWKNRWQLWVNQWTPWKNRLKPWKNRWAVQMGHFSSKIQQSTVFLLQNVASSKEKRPRLKNKKTRCSPRTRMLTRMLTGHRCRSTWICSHVEHFCETVYLNSRVHFSPVTIPVHRRLWNMEEGGVQSVQCGV